MNSLVTTMSKRAAEYGKDHWSVAGFQDNLALRNNAVDEYESARKDHYVNLGEAREHLEKNRAQYQQIAAEEARADGVDLNFEMSHRDQANYIADLAEADEAARAAGEQHPAA